MKRIPFLLSLLLCVITTACANQPASDSLTAPNGKTVILTAIKHASIRIQYDGVEIEVDPVGRLEPATDYSKMPKADIILVTHEHYDHLDPTAIGELTKESTRLIANPNSERKLGRGTALRPGDSLRLAPDIEVEAVPAYNTSAGKLQFHPKGRDNGYVLTLGGLRIYIAGDTEDIPEMGQLRDIDVAFLPCNLPYTMTPEQCAHAARLVRPSVLFPYHYSDTKIQRVADLLKGSGIDVRIRSYR
jgi:L-ascorbate metabolism protein UlaG (beta-lactamase superfamily)